MRVKAPRTYGFAESRLFCRHCYGSEDARAVPAFGFDTLELPDIVSITTNLGSQAVMSRIDMTRDRAGDFDDPDTPEGPLRRNALDRIAARPDAT